MSKGDWRLGLLLAEVSVVAGLLWVGWRWSEVRQRREMMAQVEQDMTNGRHALAVKILLELQALYPGLDEAAFLLGNCQIARGRADEAEKAWASVRPNSTFAYRAFEKRVALIVDQGRLAEAEQLIARTRPGPRFTSSELNLLLGPIYCREGRDDEAAQLIEAQWRNHNAAGRAASEIAIDQIRGHIQIRTEPLPIESIRAFLDQAGRAAPADERIWLWKAKLAIRTKLYDEAAQLLGLCLAKRPEDVAVWRARLDWAMATNRVSEAREALNHLPAPEPNSAQVEKLAGWFAARRGDDEAERNCLEHLIAIEPTDFHALDRLIELLAKNKQSDHAAALRLRKAEIERAQTRYMKLFARRQPRRDSEEMARLAEQLGYQFEARAFFTVALAAAPNRADLKRDLKRLEQSVEQLPVASARTLADAIVPQLAGGPQQSDCQTRHTIEP